MRKKSYYINRLSGWYQIFHSSPYISILKLKSSIVDVSVVAVTCVFLYNWDFRVVIATVSGVLVHGGCDIINDIYDIEIDRICKPKGAIAFGQIRRYASRTWLPPLHAYIIVTISSRNHINR